MYHSITYLRQLSSHFWASIILVYHRWSLYNLSKTVFFHFWASIILVCHQWPEPVILSFIFLCTLFLFFPTDCSDTILISHVISVWGSYITTNVHVMHRLRLWCRCYWSIHGFTFEILTVNIKLVNIAWFQYIRKLLCLYSYLLFLICFASETPFIFMSLLYDKRNMC